MWQARHVAERLRLQMPHLEVEIVRVTTTGDRVQSQPLRDFGGLGVFTREIQLCLLRGEADIAVHSLKDLPTTSVPGLMFCSVLEREDPADVLVLPMGRTGDLQTLPAGSRIATGSIRRQAQLKFLRPDCQVCEVRGNVETRLHKLDEGEFDALVLAAAGLRRLGLTTRINQRLTPPLMFGAVGQGALGLECRVADARTAECLLSLRHEPSWWQVLAERSLLQTLRAGCHAPVGVHSHFEHDQLCLEAIVLSPDGTHRWQALSRGLPTQAVQIGQAVACSLLKQGACWNVSAP